MSAAALRSLARATLPALLAAALLALPAPLGISPARAESPSERLVASWAETIRASGATVEWSGLSRAEAEDRVDLRDLIVTTTGNAPLRVEIPALTLGGLAERTEGGFTARAVSAPVLIVSSTASGPKSTLRVVDIAVRDAVVPRFTAPPFDADHPTASFWATVRLFDPLAVGSASFATLTLRNGEDDASNHGSFEMTGFEIAGLGAGRLERLRSQAMGFAAAYDGKAAKMSTDDIEIVGLDLGAWRHLWDDAEYVGGKGDGLWRRMLASAHTGRIAIETGDGHLSIDRATIGERRLRQFDEPLGALAERLVVRPDDASRADGLRLMIESFFAAASDGWSIEGFHVDGPDVDHADIARIATGAFSEDRLAEFTLEGLDVLGDRTIMRLARFALTDLRLPTADDLRRAVPAALAGAPIDPSSLIPTLRRLAVERLEVAEPGVPAVRLEALRLDFDHHLRAVPTAVDLAIDHFVVPAGLADAESRKTLAGLGYDRIDFSAALSAAWNEANRDLVVDTLRLAVADFGDVTATARLTGVPRSLFLRPDTAATAIGTIRVAAARAVVTDASFVDRLLRVMARDEKTSPARIRRRLAAEIGDELRVVRDPERRRTITEAVRRFVQAPKSLVLEMRSSSPIPLPELKAGLDDLPALAERLDLSVSSAP